MALLNPVPGTPAAASNAIDIPFPGHAFLEHMSYDPASLQLTVDMKNGNRYIHFYVLPAIVDEWIKAPSKGKYYNAAIKNKFTGNKIINHNSPARHEALKPKTEIK